MAYYIRIVDWAFTTGGILPFLMLSLEEEFVIYIENLK